MPIFSEKTFEVINDMNTPVLHILDTKTLPYGGVITLTEDVRKALILLNEVYQKVDPLL